MQRGALEVVVQEGQRWLRILTTHLEYYSTGQRIAQVHALRRLHAEALTHAGQQRPDSSEPGSPFAPAPRPASALLCGDFNFRPEGVEHALLTAPAEPGVPALFDAWRLLHPDEPHPPTFRVHDPGWPPYCCDFVFVSADLAAHLRGITIDAGTAASDHQPVVVELCA